MELNCVFLVFGFIVVGVAANEPWGEPLFLTPLIRAYNLTFAREASRVTPVKGHMDSFSGFLTVDDRYDSKMFFWYFPAEKAPSTAPVVLWLQGGPGTSALFGLFNENGPFYVKPHRGLRLRKYHLSQLAHVIYIDSPVGTGFSFTNSSDGYARDQTVIVENLYECLMQLFVVFREIIPNEFYIFGESYGAKTAVMLANKIDSMNPGSLLKINLKGIALQNGMYDPDNMMMYSEHLYQVGLLDSNGKTQCQQMENKIVDLIGQRKYAQAFYAFDSLITGKMSEGKSLLQRLTNYTAFENYLHFKDDRAYGDYMKYLGKNVMKRALHVGNLEFHHDNKVNLFLMNDLLMTVKDTVEDLLERYRVIIYVGQLDIMVNYPMTVNALNKLRWSGALQYEKQPRELWRVDDQVTGYYKTVKNFTELLILNVGQKVSYDNSRIALDVVKHFILGQSCANFPNDITCASPHRYSKSHYSV